MREGLGRNPTVSRALYPVITNDSGCTDGISDLAATDLALVVGSVAPHPSEAVRLQLKADGQRPSLTGMHISSLPDRCDVGEGEECEELFCANHSPPIAPVRHDSLCHPLDRLV